MKKLLLLLFLIAGAARTTYAEEPVRFFVERIELRNLHHASRDVILAEARLHENAVYSEADLHDAHDRLVRLPFVLGAEFALEKGSHRDAYNLVVTVNETRNFFYNVDLVGYRSDDGPFRIVSEDLGVSAVGFRWFPGNHGMFHVALGSQREYSSTNGKTRSTAEAGYTRYGLFGSDAFASVSVAIPAEGTSENDKVTFLPQITVGIPLTRTQTLTTSFTSSDFEFARDQFRRKAVRIEWQHNTTNHPFFPTRGTLLAAGPLFASDDAQYEFFNRETHDTEFRRDRTHTIGLSLAAAHYWELSERNSLSLRGEADLRHTTGKRNDENLDSSYTPSSVRIGWSRSLWSPDRVAEDGDMRLEAALRYMTGRKDFQFVDNHSTFASVDWVRRNSWGTLRLGVGYAW